MLAFSNDYYGMIFRATQSVELFCAYHLTESVVQEMRNILQKLYWLLSTVLRLSALHDIYIPPKAPEEYKKLKMQNIITFVTEFENPQDPLWDKAIHIIKNSCCMRLEEISINIIVFFMKRSKNLKEKRRKRLLRKRVFLKSKRKIIRRIVLP